MATTRGASLLIFIKDRPFWRNAIFIGVIAGVIGEMVVNYTFAAARITWGEAGDFFSSY
jgi:hypothetical protein